MVKRSLNMPGQESMFTKDPVTREEVLSAPSESLENAGVTDELPTGLAVDIKGRNANLNQALITFGKMSQSTGFQQASDPQNRTLRRGLEGRYGGNLDEVVEQSKNKRETERETSAKDSFSAAFGYLGLLSSGLIEKDTLDVLRDQEFSQFKQKYTSSHNLKRRDGYKKRLGRLSKSIGKQSPEDR